MGEPKGCIPGALIALKDWAEGYRDGSRLNTDIADANLLMMSSLATPLAFLQSVAVEIREGLDVTGIRTLPDGSMYDFLSEAFDENYPDPLEAFEREQGMPTTNRLYEYLDYFDLEVRNEAEDYFQGKTKADLLLAAIGDWHAGRIFLMDASQVGKADMGDLEYTTTLPVHEYGMYKNKYFVPVFYNKKLDFDAAHENVAFLQQFANSLIEGHIQIKKAELEHRPLWGVLESHLLGLQFRNPQPS